MTGKQARTQNHNDTVTFYDRARRPGQNPPIQLGLPFDQQMELGQEKGIDDLSTLHYNEKGSLNLVAYFKIGQK